VTIDLGDRTLLPGLIDCHVHLTSDLEGDFYLAAKETIADDALRGAKNARLTLDAGFTTVRNVGARGFADVSLMHAIDKGFVPGPRIIPAGHALGITGGHADETGFAPGVMEQGIENGVCDGPDACVKAVRYQIKHGAQWIKTNRALLINMYAQYAAKTYAASRNKPVIWWLEGDFEQYTVTGTQTSALTMAELGALARDITCAIKANEPNAIVAMNHAPWISNDQSNAFWGAMPMDVIDLVWVQGAGDTGTFLNSGPTNAATATYAWLFQKTGRHIMAETSFATAGQNDRWTTASAANINARITEGVIGVNVNAPGSNYQTQINGLASQLNPVCQ